MSDTQTATATATAPARRRGRRRLGRTLLVIGAVLAPITMTSLFVRTIVLDTDRYVETVSPLGSDPAIRAEAVARITDTIMSAVDIEAILTGALPGRLQVIAGPVETAVRTTVADTTETGAGERPVPGVVGRGEPPRPRQHPLAPHRGRRRRTAERQGRRRPVRHRSPGHHRPGGSRALVLRRHPDHPAGRPTRTLRRRPTGERPDDRLGHARHGHRAGRAHPGVLRRGDLARRGPPTRRRPRRHRPRHRHRCPDDGHQHRPLGVAVRLDSTISRDAPRPPSTSSPVSSVRRSGPSSVSDWCWSSVPGSPAPAGRPCACAASSARGTRDRRRTVGDRRLGPRARHALRVGLVAVVGVVAVSSSVRAWARSSSAASPSWRSRRDLARSGARPAIAVDGPAPTDPRLRSAAGPAGRRGTGPSRRPPWGRPPPPPRPPPGSPSRTTSSPAGAPPCRRGRGPR